MVFISGESTLNIDQKKNCKKISGRKIKKTTRVQEAFLTPIKTWLG
jgi:hypothetical protein